MRPRSGAAGEEAAAGELERTGYRILERNWRCRLGEIDMVAMHDGALVFVEVKTRSSSCYGAPAECVDFRKRTRLERLARAFLSTAPPELARAPCRFDVVSVIARNGRVESIEVIQDAFRV